MTRLLALLVTAVLAPFFLVLWVAVLLLGGALLGAAAGIAMTVVALFLYALVFASIRGMAALETHDVSRFVPATGAVIGILGGFGIVAAAMAEHVPPGEWLGSLTDRVESWLDDIVGSRRWRPESDSAAIHITRCESPTSLWVAAFVLMMTPLGYVIYRFASLSELRSSDAPIYLAAGVGILVASALIGAFLKQPGMAGALSGCGSLSLFTHLFLEYQIHEAVSLPDTIQVFTAPIAMGGVSVALCKGLLVATTRPRRAMLNSGYGGDSARELLGR